MQISQWKYGSRKRTEQRPLDFARFAGRVGPRFYKSKIIFLFGNQHLKIYFSNFFLFVKSVPHKTFALDNYFVLPLVDVFQLLVTRPWIFAPSHANSCPPCWQRLWRFRRVFLPNFQSQRYNYPVIKSRRRIETKRRYLMRNRVPALVSNETSL